MALTNNNFGIQPLTWIPCGNETVKIRDQISVRFIQAIAAFTLAADGRL